MIFKMKFNLIICMVFLTISVFTLYFLPHRGLRGGSE